MTTGLPDVVVGDPPYGVLRNNRWLRDLRSPQLRSWSIRQADVAEITGVAREDYERELRISGLGLLLCAGVAMPLWRRVCLTEMMREIRARSLDQRLLMELVILESMR